MTVQSTNMREKMFYGGKMIIQGSTNNINVNRYSREIESWNTSQCAISWSVFTYMWNHNFVVLCISHARVIANWPAISSLLLPSFYNLTSEL